MGCGASVAPQDIYAIRRIETGECHDESRLSCDGMGDCPGSGKASTAKAPEFRHASSDNTITTATDASGASHSSIYTEVALRDRYETLDEVLAKSLKNESLGKLITGLLGTCGRIAEALRVNMAALIKSNNAFGDPQLTVDVLADGMLWDFARGHESVFEASSEERPELSRMHPDGQYVLCWDPLDGSSIVDNNWAVGTIVGVWDRSTGLVGATGRDQVFSLVVVYGPRCTAYVTLGDGVYEFMLRSGSRCTGATEESAQRGEDVWTCTRERLQVRPDSRLFSPANLRAAQELRSYGMLIDHYMSKRATLRYTGGLVPDVCQQLTKGQGIFTNPASVTSPAKLRLSFEAAPLALLIERAGGRSSDGVTGRSVLDTRITAVDQRTALAIGSSNEVQLFNEMVLGLPAPVP